MLKLLKKSLLRPDLFDHFTQIVSNAIKKHSFRIDVSLFSFSDSPKNNYICDIYITSFVEDKKE